MFFELDDEYPKFSIKQALLLLPSALIILLSESLAMIFGEKLKIDSILHRFH